MGNPEQPRARFAPIPIETTYSSNRKSRKLSHPKTIPIPELTPEPSPRTPSPAFAREQQQQQQQQQQQRERRRFHPQLIETSRRSRRVGDHGPATRPTDKTDITPYTNHIYSAKPRPARRKFGCTLGEDEHAARPPPSQRETEHEDFNGYLLDLAAKEAERQLEEAALAAFPNSRAREGGVAHFYFRDGSGSENSPEGTPPDEGHQIMPRPRRKSSNLGLNWWHKHMQEHAMHLAHDRGEDDQEHQQEGQGGDGDQKSEEATAATAAAAAAATTTATITTTIITAEAAAAVDDQITSPVLYRTDSDLDKMDFDLPPDPMWTTTKARTTMDRGEPLAGLPAEETPGLSHAPVSHTSPDAGRQKHNPFGRPFGDIPLPAAGEAELMKLRKLASPPMLGKELVFRTCPSPKLTKLETDHPFDHSVAAERCRDLSGQSGLWRGYCCRSESANNCIVPAELHDPAMLMTPRTPATPRDQGCSCAANPIIEEPASIWSSDDTDGGHLASSSLSLLSTEGCVSSGSSVAAASLWTADKRHESAGPTGLHQLHGLTNLNERLQREKAQAERDEKISLEFGEEFVTQVYNYLSLGYPAMAREFDEELCRITRVSVEELRRDDAKQMAKGHMLEAKLYEADRDDRCPRWLALRIYITEWARQHPDLDSLDPLAWGVRERRGSWAI